MILPFRSFGDLNRCAVLSPKLLQDDEKPSEKLKYFVPQTITNAAFLRFIDEEQMSIVTTSELSGTSLAKGFENIFKECAQLVYRTAYGVTGSHEDAEDVLQTIFLRLMQREFPPDIGKNPKAYLYRAAVNLSLDMVRSHRRQVFIDDAERLKIPDPSDSSVDDELHRRLYEAIAELKPGSAEILILRYVHNKSDAEIARTLGVSRGTIALRLFRSRARLRKLLRARQGEER